MGRVANIAARTVALYGFLHIKDVAATAVVAATFLFSGCTAHGLSYATDVDPCEWISPAIVTIPNTDTTSLLDMAVFIRSNNPLSTAPLTLQITLYTPDSLRYEEQLLIGLPKHQNPAATAQETRIPYRTRIRFGHIGNYRVQITPTASAIGIEAVGIHIEKSN